MARKREGNKPRVPQPRAATGARQNTRVYDAESPSALTSGPRNIGFEEFYTYVRADLTRIAIFGTLIIGGMLLLKFVGGL